MRNHEGLNKSDGVRRYAACGSPGGVRGGGGFTLVEILIVVVILGILAAIVLPSIADATNGTQQTAFVTDLVQYHKAGQVFMTETGTFLEDSSSGVVPTGFETYIRASGWLDGTPIGGAWDAELGTGGIASSIGVHFDDPSDAKDDAYMTAIDGMLDDGDLTSGGFRKISDGRFYLILAR